MTQNRRIVLNIVATYGRSLYALVIGLFTARWALMALDKVDCGLMVVSRRKWSNTRQRMNAARQISRRLGLATGRGCVLRRIAASRSQLRLTSVPAREKSELARSGIGASTNSMHLLGVQRGDVLAAGACGWLTAKMVKYALPDDGKNGQF